jgi:hypothetical protein
MRLLPLLLLPLFLSACFLVPQKKIHEESEVTVISSAIKSSRNPGVRVGVVSSNPLASLASNAFLANPANRMSFSNQEYVDENTLNAISELGVVHLKKVLLAVDGVSVFNTLDTSKLDYFIRFNCTEISSGKEVGESYLSNIDRIESGEHIFYTKELGNFLKDENGNLASILFFPAVLALYPIMIVETSSVAMIQIFLINPFLLATGLPTESSSQLDHTTFKFDMHIFTSEGVLQFGKSYYVTIFSKISGTGISGAGTFHGLFLTTTAVDGLQALIPEMVKDINAEIKGRN